MRPRRIAAENLEFLRHRLAPLLRFNEAAANRRGKRVTLESGVAVHTTLQ